MAIALQIRDVPEGVRDVLSSRASRAGKSMQAYLLELVTRDAATEVNVRVFEKSAGARVRLPEELPPESIIRESRDGGAEFDRGAP